MRVLAPTHVQTSPFDETLRTSNSGYSAKRLTRAGIIRLDSQPRDVVVYIGKPFKVYVKKTDYDARNANYKSGVSSRFGRKQHFWPQALDR